MWDRSPFIQNSFFLSHPNCPIFAEIRKMLYGFSLWERAFSRLNPWIFVRLHTKVIKGLLSRDDEVNSRIILQGLFGLLTSENKFLI